MYRGVLERLSEPEIDQVMIMMIMMIVMIMMIPQLLEAVSHLEITGMRPGDKLASVKLEAMETESPQVNADNCQALAPNPWSPNPNSQDSISSKTQLVPRGLGQTLRSCGPPSDWLTY